MKQVDCSVCGSSEQLDYLYEGAFRVVKCKRCDHLYTSPIFDEEAYSLDYESSGDWIKATQAGKPSGSSQRFKAYADELVNLLPSGGKILEIGCSKGHFLWLMEQRGFECYGIEPSCQDAELAMQLLNGRVQRGFYNGCFPFTADAVIMLEVLEHIPEPHRIVELVFQQLRPGGYFMGSIPNGEFIRIKVLPRRVMGLEKLIVPLTMDAGNHINYFTQLGLRTMLERSNFQLLWVRNSPMDFNYIDNKFSPLLKRLWVGFAGLTKFLTGRLIGSNIWFLAKRPQ